MIAYVLNIANGNRFYYFSSLQAAISSVIAYIHNYYSDHSSFVYQNCIDCVLDAANDMKENFEIEGLLSWTKVEISDIPIHID